MFVRKIVSDCFDSTFNTRQFFFCIRQEFY